MDLLLLDQQSWSSLRHSTSSAFFFNFMEKGISESKKSQKEEEKEHQILKLSVIQLARLNIFVMDFLKECGMESIIGISEPKAEEDKTSTKRDRTWLIIELLHSVLCSTAELKVSLDSNEQQLWNYFASRSSEFRKDIWTLLNKLSTSELLENVLSGLFQLSYRDGGFSVLVLSDFLQQSIQSNKVSSVKVVADHLTPFQGSFFTLLSHIFLPFVKTRPSRTFLQCRRGKVAFRFYMQRWQRQILCPSWNSSLWTNFSPAKTRKRLELQPFNYWAFFSKMDFHKKMWKDFDPSCNF